MASIREIKRKGGRLVFKVQWRVDGHFKCKTLYTREAAKDYKTEIEYMLMKGLVADPVEESRTFQDWAAEWTTTCRVGKKPGTVSTEKANLRNHILPVFGAKKIGDIKRKEVKTWVASMSDKVADGEMAVSTLRNVYFTFSGCMRAAVKNEVIAKSPCVEIDLPRLVDMEEMRFLTVEDVAQLAEVVPTERDRVIIMVLAYGGLRFGELIALRRKDVNELVGQLHVRRAITEVEGRQIEGTPKNRKSRTIRLPGFVMKELAVYMEAEVETPPDSLLFPGPSGGWVWHSTFWRRVWEPALEAADLGKVRIHDLRHTCVSNLRSKGWSSLAVQKHLGHSSSQMMDRYSHLFDDDHGKYVDRLDDEDAKHFVAQSVAQRRLDDRDGVDGGAENAF